MKDFVIRAEDKNEWETRTPIVPSDLREILELTGCHAYVQRSSKRRFCEELYKQAGAEIIDSGYPGDIIFGIKEIPIEKIEDRKIYIYFSHTIKGQKLNMPALKRIIEGGSTLIDYEKIMDGKDRRLIFFGRYAGNAGAIDILWLLGEYWSYHGIVNPFSAIKQALNYKSIKAAQEHLKRVGDKIKLNGLPTQLSPLVIGILGYGNVSKGAQEIFDCLPVERISPEKLNDFINDRHWNKHTVYLSIFKEEHLVFHKEGASFELQYYYQHPQHYSSKFEQYLPYISIIVNAIYWNEQYPRFVTWESLRKLFTQTPDARLYGIADISCDVNGTIECTVKTTDSGSPAYLCDPLTRNITDTHLGHGIVLLAVDNLPCEFAYDASIFFSRHLKKFIPNILSSNFMAPLKKSELDPAIQNAVIVYNGQLTQKYQYLNQYL